MDRDEIRGWDSDALSDDVTNEIQEDVWKTVHDTPDDSQYDLPDFSETKAMYQELFDLEPPPIRLTGGFCYYLGVLDGPPGSDLSPANKQRHISYLTDRVNAVDPAFRKVMRANGIGMDELLRLFISILHFGDTDPARQRISTWYATEDTVNVSENLYKYTPYERFIHDHSKYIEKIVNQVCPGEYYLLPKENSEKEPLCIMQNDMRSAIQAILWRCIPETEKMSYRVHHIG